MFKNLETIINATGTLVIGALGEACTYAAVEGILKNINYGPGAYLILGDIGLSNLAISAILGKMTYDSIVKIRDKGAQ